MYVGTPYGLISSDVLMVLSALSVKLSTYGPMAIHHRMALKSLYDYLGTEGLPLSPSFRKLMTLLCTLTSSAHNFCYLYGMLVTRFLC